MPSLVEARRASLAKSDTLLTHPYICVYMHTYMCIRIRMYAYVYTELARTVCLKLIHSGWHTLRNCACVGLARTIYIRCIYGTFGREITKYTVIYGVYIRFWPTLCMCTRLRQMHSTISRRVSKWRSYTHGHTRTSWRCVAEMFSNTRSHTVSRCVYTVLANPICTAYSIQHICFLS